MVLSGASSKSNLSKCHFMQHQSHIDWTGIELGYLGWEYNTVLTEPPPHTHTHAHTAKRAHYFGKCCFCWASQHLGSGPASYCLRQNVSRCDTATSCNCQQFRTVQQWDLNNITSKHKGKNHRSCASGLVRNFSRNKMRDGVTYVTRRERAWTCAVKLRDKL